MTVRPIEWRKPLTSGLLSNHYWLGYFKYRNDADFSELCERGGNRHHPLHQEHCKALYDYRTGRSQSQTRRPWPFWRWRTSHALNVQGRWVGGILRNIDCCSRSNWKYVGGWPMRSPPQPGLNRPWSLLTPSSPQPRWHFPRPPTEGGVPHHRAASETC